MSVEPEAMPLLPSSEEIMSRLTAAFDEPHMIERLYPKLAQNLGGKFVFGAPIGFMTAIHDYLAEMPAAVALTSAMVFPQLVEAVVDDENTREATLEALRSMNSDCSTAH